jgi:hypothetical protein
MDVKKISWFKYATWNIRGLGEKEEELDKILNENNIKIQDQMTIKTQKLKKKRDYGWIQ